MLGFIAGIIPLLIMISIIVSFHEYGHYSVARLFNTRIDRFSVGFGKILWSRRDKRGVEWCISAIPLGGYVKFAGDNNIASMVPSVAELDAAREAISEREGAAAVSDYFHFKPLWQRFLIILAGPVFNFILAMVIFTALFAAFGEEVHTPVIDQVKPNSPAAASGLQPGDEIKSIDGHATNDVMDVMRLVALHADTPVRIVVERNHAPLTLMATPKRAELGNGNGSGGVIGIALRRDGVHRSYNPLSAAVRGTQEVWIVIDTNLTYIGRIFSGHENGDQFTGLIGMTKKTGDQAVAVAHQNLSLQEKALDLGFTWIQMIAFISIGVGFVNLLPIPILDGGHLVFYLIQSVTKKPVSGGIQTAAFPIAVALVIGLMLFAAWNDINHTGLAQFIGSRFIGGLFS
ncbi:MAG: M50 family metallopeptidase [Asticcacaulis sp.]